MGIIKNTILGIVGLTVAGGATVAAVPQLRNKALDFVASKSETYQQVVDERDAYKADSEEKDATIASLTADKTALQTQLNQALAEKNALETQLQTATTEKQTIQTQLNEKLALIENLQAQIAEKETELANKIAEVNRLAQQNTALETENANLKSFKYGKFVWIDGDDTVMVEVLNNGTVKFFIDDENYIVCPYVQDGNNITVTFTENDETYDIVFEITSQTTFESVGEENKMSFVYLTEELENALTEVKTLKNRIYIMGQGETALRLTIRELQDNYSQAMTNIRDLQLQLDATNNTIDNLNETIAEKDARIAELEQQLENSGSSNVTMHENLLDPRISFAGDVWLDFNGHYENVISHNDFLSFLNSDINYYEQIKEFVFEEQSTGISAVTSVQVQGHEGAKNQGLTCSTIKVFYNQNGEQISADSLAEYNRIHISIRDFNFEFYKQEEITAYEFTDMNAPIKSAFISFTVWGENVVEYDFSNASFVPVEPGHDFRGKPYLKINSFNIHDNYIDIYSNAGYFYGQVIDENTLLIDNVIYKRATNIRLNEGAEEFFSSSYKSLILTYDLQLNEPVEITEDTVICLVNGKAIYGANIDGAAFKVMNGATLTIYGNGSIVGGSGANCRAIEVVDGTLNILDGIYSVGPDAEGAGNSTIYASGDNAVINIYAGDFSSDADWNGFYYVLNQNNSATNAKFNVYGGRFKNYNPGIGDDALGGNYVADGYEVNAEDADGATWYVVHIGQTPVDPIVLPSEFTCVSKQDESKYYEFNNGQFRYYHDGVFEIGTYTFDSENNNLTLNFTQGGISYTIGVWTLDGHVYFDLNGETFC